MTPMKKYEGGKMKKTIILSLCFILAIFSACNENSKQIVPQDDSLSKSSMQNKNETDSTDEELDERNSLLNAATGNDSSANNNIVKNVNSSSYEVIEGVLYYSAQPVDINSTVIQEPNLCVDDFSFFSSFTELESLVLDNSNINDLSVLTQLPKLNHIALKDCDSVTSIEPLIDCMSLTSLHLTNCNNIDNLSAIAEMVNLKELIIAFSNDYDIGNLSYLESLKALETLYLLVDLNDISFLKGLQCLECLHLSIKGVMDYSAISQLSELSTLVLDSSGIVDISILSELNKLEYLYLGCEVEDISKLVEFDFPNLKELMCRCTENDLLILKQAFPGCSINASIIQN